MKTEKTEQFLNFCCEMGRALIQNGAEIYRVEDSINRLLLAYGYLDTEVFAIPSCVILNIQHEGHQLHQVHPHSDLLYQSGQAGPAQQPLPPGLPGASAGGGGL